MYAYFDGFYLLGEPELSQITNKLTRRYKELKKSDAIEIAHVIRDVGTVRYSGKFSEQEIKDALDIIIFCCRGEMPFGAKCETIGDYFSVIKYTD